MDSFWQPAKWDNFQGIFEKGQIINQNERVLYLNSSGNFQNFPSELGNFTWNSLCHHVSVHVSTCDVPGPGSRVQEQQGQSSSQQLAAFPF